MSLRWSLFLKSTGVAVLALAVLTVPGESKNERRATASREASVGAPASGVVTQPLPSQSQNQDVHGLVIAIHPTGFTPPEMEVAAGRYLFIVQNRSGIDDLAFRFDRQNADKLHEVRDHRLQWKKQFDLHPGTYVLSVVDHPEWTCVVTVKPH